MRVMAVGGRWPWSSSEKKIVARTATPIELPSCWIAFSVPDAEPTSWSSTPARMTLKSGPKTKPMPRPKASSAGTSCQLDTPRPSWVTVTASQTSAPATISRPACSTLRPKRGISA